MGFQSSQHLVSYPSHLFVLGAVTFQGTQSPKKLNYIVKCIIIFAKQFSMPKYIEDLSRMLDPR